MNFHLREMSQPSPNFSSWYHEISYSHQDADILEQTRRVGSAYREDIALVTSLFRASSFFLRSSAEESSISS